MARHVFGGTAAEVAEDISGARVPGAVGTVWDGPSDGALRITDLMTLDEVPITEVTANTEGMLPPFQGPDEVTKVYVDFGAGRVALLATDTSEILDAHLEASDPHGVRAAIEAQKGIPTGFATLDTAGKVTPAQLPEIFYNGAGVVSVNGKTGDAVLTAQDVGAIPTTGSATVSGNLTVTGNAIVNGTSTAKNVDVDGAAATLRMVNFKTAGSQRWRLQVSDLSESGSNEGSNFSIAGYNDSGSLIRTVLAANRATGNVSIGSNSLHGNAALTVSAALAIKDQATDPDTVTGGVYLYSKGGIPYVKQGNGSVFQVGETVQTLAWTNLSTLATWSATFPVVSGATPRMRKLRQNGTEIWEFEGAFRLGDLVWTDVENSTITLPTGYRPTRRRGFVLPTSSKYTVYGYLDTNGSLLVCFPTGVTTSTVAYLDGLRITNPV